MSSNLESFLGLDRDISIPENLVVIENSMFGVDGSFIIHHVLCSHLRKGKKVCLYSNTQSLMHYSQVALKLGVNLQNQIKTGKFVFVDGLAILRDGLETKCSDHGSQLKYVYDIIKDKYLNILKDGDASEPVLLVIDNISVLLTMCDNYASVIDFYQYCQSLVSLQRRPGCLCVLSEECEEHVDEDGYRLAMFLRYHNNSVVSVSGLSSGFCKDVHGEVTMVRKEFSKVSTTKMQFKVEDKCIRLFASGTSVAALGSLQK